MPRFSGCLRAHQERGGGTVVETACVGRRDRAVLGEGGAQFLHRLHRGAVADVFVAVHDDVALAGRDRHRRDLVDELAGLLRGLGLVLGGHGEFVLHVAGDLPLLGHVLGGLAHVIAVERVPEAVADHRVDIFQVAHLLALPQRRGVGAHGHVLLPAGHDHFGIAQHDVLCAECHGPEARAADLGLYPRPRFPWAGPH